MFSRYMNNSGHLSLLDYLQSDKKNDVLFSIRLEAWSKGQMPPLSGVFL